MDPQGGEESSDTIWSEVPLFTKITARGIVDPALHSEFLFFLSFPFPHCRASRSSLPNLHLLIPLHHDPLVSWLTKRTKYMDSRATSEVNIRRGSYAIAPCHSLANYTINFRHPSYHRQNIFLTLPAFDDPDGGLHYGTAFLSCAIIAGNAWDGYFTTSVAGPVVEMGDNQLLREKDYYFHVPSSGDGPYPIYPSFEHWQFPHESLPPSWYSGVTQAPQLFNVSSSNLSTAIIGRDRSCQVTGYHDGLEAAHLCPRSELAWFSNNEMARYNLNQQLAIKDFTNDISNVIALRADVYRVFDAGGFVIVRKNSNWVVHFLNSTTDLGRIYQNIAIDLSSDISPHFLLARFAWAVFPKLKVFLSTGFPRRLRLQVETDDGVEEQVVTRQGADLKGLASGSTQAASKKRKHSGSDCNDGLDMDCLSSGCSTVSNQPDIPSSIKAKIIQDLDWTSANTAELVNATAARSRTDIRCKQCGLLRCVDLEACRIRALVGRELRKQRPTDPQLLCCDYNAADAAFTSKNCESRKYDLCLQCIGVELKDKLPKIENWESQTLSEEDLWGCS